MPSTTVHIPDRLLSKIDQIVREQNISRNRFIIRACENALKNNAGQWPEGFFESDLSEEDLKLLEEGVSEMEAAIVKTRRNRRGIDL
jgi:hypothetical protein